MLFMNSGEIDAAADRHQTHPVLGPATRLLRQLRDLADEVSDGWCYWHRPCRAAERLQRLIQDAGPRPIGGPTAAELRKAVTPIRSFLTRHREQLRGRTLDFSELPK